MQTSLTIYDMISGLRLETSESRIVPVSFRADMPIPENREHIFLSLFSSDCQTCDMSDMLKRERKAFFSWPRSSGDANEENVLLTHW